MLYNDSLIGNFMLLVLYGGVFVVFLEVMVLIVLSWSMLWEDMELGVLLLDEFEEGKLLCLFKMIDFLVDYLCIGLFWDFYVWVILNCLGCCYVFVFVEVW